MQLIGTIVALFSLSSPRSRRKNHHLSRNKSKNNHNNNNNNNNNNQNQNNQKLNQNQRNKLNIHDTKVKWAHETNAAILIDVENVRGKSNFELTHDQILHQIPRWASFRHLTGQVSLVVDHGSVPSAHYLSDEQLAVVFAGPRIKADDVIARDVAFFASHTNNDDDDHGDHDKDGDDPNEKIIVGGGQTVMVITADNELMSRCRNAMSKAMPEDPRTLSEPNIQFVHPLQFISDLEVVMKEEWNEQQQQRQQQQALQVAESSSIDSVPDNDGGSSSDKNDDDNTKPSISKELASQIEEEIKLRGAMYETEMQMRLKRNMNTPKKRRKLEKRARMICERLARKGGQSIDHLTAVDEGMSDYDRQFQDEVLAQWENLRRTATRKEMTGDRMLLAERFRRQIDKREKEGQHPCGESNVVNGGHAVMKKSHSYSHVQYINALMNTKSATSMSSGRRVSSSSTISTASISSSNDANGSSPFSSSSLRLVVISDTHGYEEGLTPNGSTLPDGDILLHLGDFAIDSSMKKKLKALEKFDEWLARQPHRTKIVLRGNHDPFKVHFPLSNANYYSRPTSIAIDGKYTISLVPYCSSRILSGSWRKLPMFCDVLASHVPPHKILDKCYNGQNAGCSTLRGKVERMIAGPPKLWICGHIHEGRGLVREKFGFSPRETTVINAANANLGRATHIEYGPVVVGLNDVGGDDVEVLQMDCENVQLLVAS